MRHEIQHSGGTAGYRGFLTRFPDQGLAVAVMCNAGNANPGRFARQVADLYLGDAIVTDEPDAPTVEAVEVSADRLERYAGAYKRTRDQQRGVFAVVDGVLQFSGQKLVAVAQNRFTFGGGVFAFDAESAGERPSAVYTARDGDVFTLQPVDEFDPSPGDLAEFVGEYSSAEAEVTYSFEVGDGGLARVDRYGQVASVRPYYADTFIGAGGIWMFRREGGRVTSVSLASGRVWNLYFERIRSSGAGSR